MLYYIILYMLYATCYITCNICHMLYYREKQQNYAG